jgi:hypothetical protein
MFTISTPVLHLEMLAEANTGLVGQQCNPEKDCQSKAKIKMCITAHSAGRIMLLPCNGQTSDVWMQGSKHTAKLEDFQWTRERKD